MSIQYAPDIADRETGELIELPHNIERRETALIIADDTLAELEAEYLRLQGEAATEQQRFGYSARPDFVRLAEAGRRMNEARTRWMNAKAERQS